MAMVMRNKKRCVLKRDGAIDKDLQSGWLLVLPGMGGVDFLVERHSCFFSLIMGILL